MAIVRIFHSPQYGVSFCTAETIYQRLMNGSTVQTASYLIILIISFHFIYGSFFLGTDLVVLYIEIKINRSRHFLNIQQKNKATHIQQRGVDYCFVYMNFD
ncbi:hypothetical protein KP509_26G029700 [Ceratopteris richardii]|uniref:Uncharacterized protein n=1 Tax=Ceratopteris richardii TaxID=49495 RepID=A0A8T2RJL7_CERRI|nr:hypothetical protein KP509_26G029700 [Ceratopteris richardii]